MAMSIKNLKTLFGTLLATACTLQLAAAQDSPFDRPLFPQPLFKDEPMGAQLDAAINKANQGIRITDSGTNALLASDTEYDEEMRRQMRETARFLLRYGIRNGGRFPGYSNDEMYAVQTQLATLFPNNPFGYAKNVWGQTWSEQPASQELDRIRLSMDLSLTPPVVDTWSSNPPDNWQAPAGTISAIGNSDGLFVVWGAGRNGKPIKNPSNGKAFIISGNTNLGQP